MATNIVNAVAPTIYHCVVYNTDFKCSSTGEAWRYEVRTSSWILISNNRPNPSGYILINTRAKRPVFLHRLIYHAFNPQWNIYDSTIFIDHKDRNPRNNAIANLRTATRSENARNQSVPANNKSGLKGVLVHYRKKTAEWYWVVKVTLNGKRFEKSFKGGNGAPPNPLPAVPANVSQCRDDLFKMHHGDFVCLT